MALKEQSMDGSSDESRVGTLMAESSKLKFGVFCFSFVGMFNTRIYVMFVVIAINATG